MAQLLFPLCHVDLDRDPNRPPDLQRPLANPDPSLPVPSQQNPATTF